MLDIFLGESARDNGPPSTSAWKGFGYNLDGKVTTKDSTDVCSLALGAPKLNQTDGNSGIDNAWGAVFLPILQSAASLPSPSTEASGDIQQGQTTLELSIKGLSDDPKQNATGITAQTFVGGPFGGVPSFNPTTTWPVLSTSLADGATVSGGAKTKFTSAYINNGTFVSGKSAAPLVVDVPFQGVSLELTIHDAIVTFDHSSHDTAANGTIAGVLDATEFIAMFKAIAARISLSLCGNAFDGIAQQILQAEDILIDGSNTSGTSCTGISIGLGFTAKLIADPIQVTQVPTQPDPCGH